MIVWSHWHNTGELPSYVKLCVENTARHCKDFRLVSDTMLKDFLPDLREGMIAGKPHFERSDYIRTRLLQRYGGLWVDADTWVVRDLDEKFEGIVSNHDFVYYRDFHGLVPVGFMGSRSEGTIIREYVFRQDIAVRDHVGGCGKLQIGSRMLTHVINLFGKGAGAFQVSSDVVCPIQFHEVGKFFENKDPESLPFAVLYQLYNRTFPQSWVGRSEGEVLLGDVMLSKLIKGGSKQ